MKVKEIMSKNIASVKSDDTVEKAAQMMKQYDVGSIPVCRENSVVGIVTDRDITLRSAAEGCDTKQQKVSEIMSANPVVGDPEMDVDDAARIMSEKQIRRLPIVQNNSLVGYVALGDISVEPALKEDAAEALSDISQPGHNQFS
ncbi:CBS domain-containing protein [Caproiciproducens sp. LBM24188]|nr:CBS domain-containing protein [Oscillospiraceae bacterium]HHV31328.1 CBS domain-containing protein [Clostridiales bacterium]